MRACPSTLLSCVSAPRPLTRPSTHGARAAPTRCSPRAVLQVRILCAFDRDGNSNGVVCDGQRPCIPGCPTNWEGGLITNGGECGDKGGSGSCPAFAIDQGSDRDAKALESLLKSQLSRKKKEANNKGCRAHDPQYRDMPVSERPSCLYNEFVLSGDGWLEALPYVVEAVIFPKHGGAAAEERAREVHAGFSREYGVLPSMQDETVPLLAYDLARVNDPFEDVFNDVQHVHSNTKYYPQLRCSYGDHPLTEPQTTVSCSECWKIHNGPGDCSSVCGCAKITCNFCTNWFWKTQRSVFDP